jgi:DNA-binding transcriptional ArsR family regulator
LIARLRGLGGPDRYIWVQLLQLAACAPAPRDVPALLRYLASVEADELCRHLSGYYDSDGWNPAPAALVRRTLDGDPLALRASVNPHPALPLLRSVLLLGVPGVKRELLEILAAWADRVWPAHAAATGALLRTEADSRQAVAHATSQPQRVVAGATPGITWPAPPAGVSRLVLTPSYVSRPWVLSTAARAVMIVAYPLPDARLGSARAVPRRRLARLSAALHAPHRADVLRELAADHCTLGELAERLAVQPTALRREMLTLRGAGLVAIDARTYRYRRTSPTLSDFGQLLGASLDAAGG